MLVGLVGRRWKYHGKTSSPKKTLRHLQDLKAFVDHGEEHSFNDLLDGLKDDFRVDFSQARGRKSAL